MRAVYDAVTQLLESGVSVLSPADPRVVDQIGEFVFVASDRVRSIRMVEDRHLECLRASDFLWLVAPDGYVGQSASMELGFAVAHGLPVYSLDKPADGTLQEYVRTVPHLTVALDEVRANWRPTKSPDSFLVDPDAILEQVADHLDYLRARLRGTERIGDLEGRDLLARRTRVARLLASADSPKGRRAAK